MELSFFPTVQRLHTRRLCISSFSVCPDNPSYPSKLSLNHGLYKNTINPLYVSGWGRRGGGGKRKRSRGRGEEGFCWIFRGRSLLVDRCYCECVGNGFREESGCVEVVGIGSRVDSVLDFCLRSLSASSLSSQLRCLRFWNFVMKDSRQRVLQQRLLETDHSPDVTLDQQSSPKAVLLVASAGYGEDLTISVDLLKAVKSNGGLVVAVILKPFDFEGRRRQEEVRILQQKLEECANFCIEIDINALLKMDLVTLDEALKTTNQAVFLAIRAVAVIVSETATKHIASRVDEMKELKSAREITGILDSYKQGNIGFGVGRNVETSILQAVHHCPFLCRPLKDLNGLVICILNTSNTDHCDDVPGILHAFRQMTECKQEVIISVVYDPSLQPNVVAATVIIMSTVTEQSSVKKNGILSKLAERMPFVFDIIRNYDMNPNISKVRDSPGVYSIPNAANQLDNIELSNTEEAEDSDNNNISSIAREKNREGDLLDSDDGDSLKHYQHNGNAYQRELVLSWDKVTENNNTVQEMSEEDAAVTNGAVGFLLNDKPSVFHVPVGVRDSSHAEFSNVSGTSRLDTQPKMKDDTVADTFAAVSDSSWNTGVEAVTGFYHNATALLKGRSNGVYKKQGVLSSRAASMLDAERDTQAKWRHMTRIGYRGGVYRGQCHGGLPEGRGRLQYPDESAYDGMWRHGKRSGLGSFYFSNGDVFQGTWRDDLMHGKGWLYFHNGDRWFANFWKGRANGEGRFYSKSGEVFFGRFQDGYRHGEFQCVKVDGSRFVETWKEGVLVSSDATCTVR